ncbi:hypothetical protein GCM10022221_42260 [Actinocorallia aurea]
MPPELAADAGTADVNSWVVAVAFRDASGIRWYRDALGRLRELPAPD